MPSQSDSNNPAPSSEKQSSQAGGMGGFAKGLQVIEAFSASAEALTIAEVAHLTGLDRATARRCIITLINSGYALAEGRRFKLTPRVLRLSQSYLNSPLPRLLQPYLEALAERLQESCSSAVLDGTDISYVARASRRRVMSIDLTPGARLPAYCTSMGRVLLASLPVEQARALLAQSNRKAFTQHTLTDLDSLMAVLEKVRSNGYALNDQELELGLSSIAVPLLNTSGKVIAALNIGTQAGRTTKKQLLGEFLPLMLQTQKQLAEILP